MRPMFPTTIWTTIRRAGEEDREALEKFALAYRPPVLRFIRGRGFNETEAQDICQDVFVRLLSGKVLSRADGDRGRFRSLLLAVTVHVIQDRFRRKKEPAVAELPALEPEASEPERNSDFDQAWMLYLAERAMARLRNESARYYEVLKKHLGGEKQDRNKLWIARGKLLGQIRAEIAMTCTSHSEFEDEVKYLSSFLRPRKDDKV